MRRRDFLLAMGSAPLWTCTPLHAVEFAPVLPNQKLVFPNDHGAHADFRTEWWYATGWLKRTDGSPLGFQVTFFRVRTGVGENNPSSFSPRQLILAHAAIADPALGRLRVDERAARVMPGRAGFETGRTGLWVGDWRLDQKDDAYTAVVNGKEFSYALTMTPSVAPVLNGIDGFSRKVADPRHASHYYSRPQMAVTGTVSLDGKPQAVSGTAWLDHEWSSELLPAGAQGWDWVGLNLDDGSGLMAFRMRDAGGAALWTAATVMPANSRATMPAREQVAFESQRVWKSPRTGITYPVAWRLRIGSRTLALQPIMDDQELDSRRSTGAVYWEGAVRVLESGREIGRGYLEMTGYGERIRMQ